MATKRAMVSNNNEDYNNNDHGNNNDREINNNQEDSSNKDDEAHEDDDDEDDGDEDENKGSAAVAAGNFFGGGSISGGDRGSVGGSNFCGWRVVAVVGLAVADSSLCNCRGCEPSRWFLKRLMGRRLWQMMPWMYNVPQLLGHRGNLHIQIPPFSQKISNSTILN
jgi:hypothetical protein